MAAAGQAVAHSLAAMKAAIVPGQTTTQDLEEIALETLAKHGAKPSLKGYRPSFSQVTYQHATCISINDEVIHGVPSPTRVLREGDVVGLDMVGNIDGWHADSTITVIVGSGSKVAQRLVSVTREAMWHGIRAALAGNTLGDIGFAVQRLVEKNGFNVVRDLSGHGIGRSVHEEGLDVVNFGIRGRGIRLVPGMTFCVEPMTAAGKGATMHKPGDPWTVFIKDGSLGAHWEHTVAVTEKGPRVLTLLEGQPMG